MTIFKPTLDVFKNFQGLQDTERQLFISEMDILKAITSTF